LQQQFNQHVFKLEQEVYLKEGIVWNMIDFYDNQPCIDLIESKLGVLDLLDEECRMPNGSDNSWVGKLNEKCSKYKHYEKARFGTSSFLVKHFSDTVQYECAGFLEKNRDTISKELVNVIQQSDMDFCRHLILFDEKDDKSNEKTKSATLRSARVVISAAKAQVTIEFILIIIIICSFVAICLCCIIVLSFSCASFQSAKQDNLRNTKVSVIHYHSFLILCCLITFL